jgi:FtsP/CotA-like multicopper oxidase with cupredoxin domain
LVQVYLELVNTTASLDGVERNVLLVNGTFPGPTIIADWGDTVGSFTLTTLNPSILTYVVVHLTNSLSNNGTGLHFHGKLVPHTLQQTNTLVGIRQNYTNQQDGKPIHYSLFSWSELGDWDLYLSSE